MKVINAILFIFFASCGNVNESNSNKTKDYSIVEQHELEQPIKLSALEMLNNSIYDWNNYDKLCVGSRSANQMTIVDDMADKFSSVVVKLKDSISVSALLKRKADSLVSMIRKTQIRVFPEARKDYFKTAKEKLWLEDVKVLYSEGTKTLTLIGHHFVTNRSIQESYLAMKEHVFALRFKRIIFKWTDYSDYTYYDTGAPSDKEIAGFD